MWGNLHLMFCDVVFLQLLDIIDILNLLDMITNSAHSIVDDRKVGQWKLQTKTHLLQINLIGFDHVDLFKDFDESRNTRTIAIDVDIIKTNEKGTKIVECLRMKLKL